MKRKKKARLCALAHFPVDCKRPPARNQFGETLVNGWIRSASHVIVTSLVFFAKDAVDGNGSAKSSNDRPKSKVVLDLRRCRKAEKNILSSRPAGKIHGILIVKRKKRWKKFSALLRGIFDSCG